MSLKHFPAKFQVLGRFCCLHMYFSELLCVFVCVCIDCFGLLLDLGWILCYLSAYYDNRLNLLHKKHSHTYKRISCNVIPASHTSLTWLARPRLNCSRRTKAYMKLFAALENCANIEVRHNG